MKPCAFSRWIPEIIDIMTFFFKSFYDFRIE